VLLWRSIAFDARSQNKERGKYRTSTAKMIARIRAGLRGKLTGASVVLTHRREAAVRTCNSRRPVQKLLSQQTVVQVSFQFIA